MSRITTLRESIASEMMRCEDVRSLEGLLEDILTHAEVEIIEERIRIMHGLASGQTQRVVSREQKASIATVSRGAKVLKYGRIRDGWRR